MLFDFRNSKFIQFNIKHCQEFFTQFGFEHLFTRFEYANSVRNNLLAVLIEQEKLKQRRPDVIIPLLEQYAAVLNSICDELKPRKEEVISKAKRNGQIKWESVLSVKTNNWSSSTNFFHEQAQVYFLLAIQHYHEAQNKYDRIDMSEGVQQEQIPELKEVMTELRTAAGLLSYAANTFFPFALTKKTPDQSSDVFRGLSSMCIALGQEFLIIIAVAGGKNPQLISKLAQGVANTYTDILAMWKRNLAATTVNAINPALRLYIQQRAKLYEAIAFKYTAKHQGSDEVAEFGKQVRYFENAMHIIREGIKFLQQKDQARAMTHPSCSMLLGSFRSQLASTNALYKSAQDDNKTIYHMIVPKGFDSVEVPDPKVMVTMVEVSDFDLPADMPVQQASNEWSAFLGKWKDEDGNNIQISRNGTFYYEGKNQVKQAFKGDTPNEVKVTYGETAFKGVLVNGTEIEWSNGRRWIRLEG